MSHRERRANMALDDAYEYCRLLETCNEKPELFCLCSAISTVDAALESSAEDTLQPLGPKISLEAWTRIRNSLFNFLITMFPGYFMVYKDSDATPVEPGDEWPDHGLIEFLPERSRRREDSYFCELDSLDFKTRTTLRWCFAEGRQNTKPADFIADPIMLEEEAVEFLERLYEICEEESTKGKKRAHQKWWQLYWEATSCRDSHEKRRLHKDMDKLQAVWGRPS